MADIAKDKDKDKGKDTKRTQPPEVESAPRRRRRRVHWVWPLGLAVAGLGGAAAFMLRGCWHADMGWPVRHDDEFSYQVCMGCGIKRLFDPKTFRAYGPHGYDVLELIARERALRMRRAQRHEERLAASQKKVATISKDATNSNE